MYEFLVREANFQFFIQFWKKDKSVEAFSPLQTYFVTLNISLSPSTNYDIDNWLFTVVLLRWYLQGARGPILYPVDLKITLGFNTVI